MHRAGHAAQGAPHKLRHLLHREHLQQLVEDGGKRVQQGGLQAQEGAQHLPCPALPAAQCSMTGTTGILNEGSAQSYYRLGYGWCSWFVLPGAHREQVTCSIEKSSAAAIVNLRISCTHIYIVSKSCILAYSL